MIDENIATLLRMLFEQPQFRYVKGGQLYGTDFLNLSYLLLDKYDGDFLLFRNGGGRALDMIVNPEHNPNNVISVLDFLNKDDVHKSWLLAYRIDGKETMSPEFVRNCKNGW